MKISIVAAENVVIEIDLETQILTTALPAVGEFGEIRIEGTDPPIVHLTLPFGQVGAAEIKAE